MTQIGKSLAMVRQPFERLSRFWSFDTGVEHERALKSISRFALGFVLASCFCAVPMHTASAQVMNGSFESGDLTNWDGAGDATVVESFGAIVPTDGSFMAVVASSSGGDIPANTLENFLGVPAGSLDSPGNGDAIEGSAIRRSFGSFSAGAGEHYAFDWSFATDEPMPSANNDFAVVTLGGVAFELADTGAEFPVPPFPAQTGFQPFCFTTQSFGEVDFGVAVLDAGDGTTPSWLLIDNLRQVADSDGDGLPDPCDFDCPATPSICRHAAKSTLLIKDSNDDRKDQLVWNWAKGQATSPLEIGDPSDSTEYRLCLYAGSTSALVQQIDVPAGGASWQPVTTGYKYKDKLGPLDGVTKVLLKGGPTNKSKALLKGKGVALPDLPAETLPFESEDYPVIVMLINNETGACFASSFDEDDVKKNAADKFRAKAD